MLFYSKWFARRKLNASSSSLMYFKGFSNPEILIDKAGAFTQQFLNKGSI